jgi:Tfp pilus assembly protein PilO
MERNKLWLVGSSLTIAIVLILGVLLGIQPQLTAAATADDQRASAEVTNAGQATVLAQLQEDFEGIDDLKAELEPLRDSVPTATEMPAFVNQLSVLAERSGVVLTGFTVADATPYAPVENPTAADAEADASSDSSETSTDSTADAANASNAGIPPVTSDQITAGNFASLAVTMSVSGAYGDTLNFVNGVQSGERLVLVSGISTTAVAADEGESASDEVTALISGLVYVLVPAAATEATAAG